MKTNVKILTAVFVACGLLLSLSCKKSETGPAGQTTSYNMFMTDSPGDYQAVYVNIIGAQVNSDVSGWVNLNLKTGIYNLLSLSNGKDTLLASGSIAVGTASQLRLILAPTGNTVVVNGISYPLMTPSAQQSGLKLDLHAQFVSGVQYNILLDFDAGMSVVTEGNGSYILKPVIRAVVSPVNGSISGRISPVSADAAVIAISANSDSAVSYSSFITGGFMVQGLASGTYKVVIIPKPPFTSTSYFDVIVNQGSVTDMGSITFQ
ncbi:MAG TPA: DUF4382 domain-containing protein [Bacteroidia bacterium]|jgi:hypothetical protein|nr:DUF4382 domain-containing protein [Bacteroidia bacterium]